MNIAKGTIWYIIMLIFVALLFFPQKEFSASIINLVNSFSSLIGGLTNPDETSIFKLIFICVTFLFLVKLFAEARRS